jgi:hypothetical protein
VLYPTGFGEPRELDLPGLDRPQWAGFHPDGRQLFVVGGTGRRPSALHLAPLDGGAPQLLWDEPLEFSRFLGLAISPDGARVVLQRGTCEFLEFEWASRTATPLRGLAESERVLAYDDTGHAVYVSGRNVLESGIEKLDLATGERTPWRSPKLADAKAVVFLTRPVVAANGSRYAYSYLRLLTNLYLVEGLKQ